VETGAISTASPATHSCVRSDCPRNARMGRKSRLFVHSIWSPGSKFADVEAEIAASLWPRPRIFPFAETLGGDQFDHDCRPTVPGVRSDRSASSPKTTCSPAQFVGSKPSGRLLHGRIIIMSRRFANDPSEHPWERRHGAACNSGTRGRLPRASDDNLLAGSSRGDRT
jgi:hypothetical protein